MVNCRRTGEVTTAAVAEIPKLKQQGSGDMFVFGSGNLSESLMKAELFDEFRLCIAPVLIGKGGLLFKQGIPHKKLKLLETRPLTTDGTILRYAYDNFNSYKNQFYS